MSCWRRTAVLRIPASALGFRFLYQWDDFLEEHRSDLESKPGCFDESMCDDFPWMLRWDGVDLYDSNRQLDQRNPAYPEIVPGPFLDYYLWEDMPVWPEDNSFGQNNEVQSLDIFDMEEYLSKYQRLFPNFTMKDMEAVRRCEYEWYDGTNAPYLYSDYDTKDAWT
jgi:hypothetical protein